MAFIEETVISCGVHSVSNLSNSTSKQALQAVGRDLFEHLNPFKFLIWSDVFGKNRKGNLLYHYIRKHFPESDVMRTKPGVNPNSGNRICVYTWRIPNSFKSWWNENKPVTKNWWDYNHP